MLLIQAPRLVDWYIIFSLFHQRPHIFINIFTDFWDMHIVNSTNI
jgi:hypothetical protein